MIQEQILKSWRKLRDEIHLLIYQATKFKLLQAEDHEALRQLYQKYNTLVFQTKQIQQSIAKKRWKEAEQIANNLKVEYP